MDTGTILERSIRAPSGCLEFQGCTTSKGYGLAYANGKLRLVHRAVYEAQVGPIPSGMTIDHLCKNRQCVDVSHLEVVTRGENSLRGNSPVAINARKTRCTNGHEFDLIVPSKNTRSGTSRACSICRREASRRYQEKKRKAHT